VKELRCREVGFECDAVVRADSEEEVMKQAQEHARKAHGLERISEDQERDIRSKIHDAR
jgi:predicted small metal-binding protein